MSDNNFNFMANHAKKIDKVLDDISRKLQDPEHFGSGQNALIRLREIDNDITTYKAVRDSMMSSLQNNINAIKSSNIMQEKFLVNHKREVERIFQIGRKFGFPMPNDFNAAFNNDTSPFRSIGSTPPTEIYYKETPLSSLRRSFQDL